MSDRIRITLTIDCPRTGVHTETREVDPAGLVPVPKVGACARDMAKRVPERWGRLHSEARHATTLRADVCTVCGVGAEQFCPRDPVACPFGGGLC